MSLFLLEVLLFAVGAFTFLSLEIGSLSIQTRVISALIFGFVMATVLSTIISIVSIIFLVAVWFVVVGLLAFLGRSLLKFLKG